VLLALWLFLAVGLSVSGWFERFSSATLFVICPAVSVAGFLISFRLSATFRKYISTRSLKRLTLVQVLRLFGILALIKTDQNVLPAVFAVPTGVFDIALAMTSLFVAKRLVSPGGQPVPGFFAWHIIGMLSFAVADALAILTSSARFGLVEGGITSQPMTSFPMSLAPTFFGPVVLICHLSALVAAYGRHSRGFRRFGGSSFDLHTQDLHTFPK
jgi:hypothetical protein